ncbi:subunit of E1(0) component of 2-oxoglutarate dehydrogenase [Rhodovastum atsumiense]|uniref:2-oxoglutarate dehydrogenase E1 component n=1 Tax=Rhodovastum atsumiense TaxID=504468 RepID=A0A5M6ISS3_9PROT|nr:2-oxoglutarate dehydrogenase E1 component [Rhodovastum atsumiense]KAA5610495.1 2-oxoglutarate dehydrogenase E1 component [Rhodovastum atsumiense]CAH2600482.1 subunit of E1(0) component of 2-oxoglutarate dehydrogenase [Rhodovastum atsumiense]
MAGVDLLATAFNGANAAFIADLYAKWAANPGSVDPSFAELFAALNDEARSILTDSTGASWAPRRWDFGEPEPVKPAAKGKGAPAPKEAPISQEAVRAATKDSLRALMMIRTYRVRGHLEARLDPLGLQVPDPHPELDPGTYGFTAADMDRPIFIDHVLGLEVAPLRQILQILRETYCGPVGVEFMHIQDPDQKAWIQRRVEGAPWRTHFDAEGKQTILRQLTEAEGLEAFCQKRYVGTKRFGLEGGEVTIPALHAIIVTAAKRGVHEIAIGMPHRGRLNTLVNVVRKPYAALFSEFSGTSFKPDDVQGSGDVKYHLGTSTDVEIGGKMVHLSLQPNPSHLEAVDPVVVGKVRARQDMAGDTRSRRGVMGILMHGDAAFAGQGLVYETLAMSQLIGYRTGGTIHVVVNNQIGFTTVPAHAYSGLYCTDVAKSIQAPILHVNGDNPEAVVWCAQTAAEFRMTFGCDIVLDIVCYRRHGHNETDEPAFTQPLMYRAIRDRKTTRALYAEQLVGEGVLGEAEVKRLWDEFTATLEDAYRAAQGYKPNKAEWLEGHWAGLSLPSPDAEWSEGATAVAPETLRQVGLALARVPEDFDVNPKIARQLDAKREMIESGKGIDWATGEALAFGTLLVEGNRVRLSGEDCQRGTFSQRHAVLVDQTSQNEYVPLNNIAPTQSKIEIYNSLLSEVGVLGFEYGYSLADPRTLVLWEAQFGDFANGAQVIIDQFIASGETKWLRMSGLVMLLPHGHEGQGPEHSSARPERYLQLCAERNIVVGNFTTPANYFHGLRRQLKRNFRKPLVLMTPKSLLRHKLCVSTLAEMGPGTRFLTVIPETDALVAPEEVKRIVLCSGKVYYDLVAERRERGLRDIAIVRLEQLYPFPHISLPKALAPYRNAEVVWCQEEPENMGAWMFVDRRIEQMLAKMDMAAKRPAFIGRPSAASPATGLAKTHAAEQAALVSAALTLG